MKVLVAEDNAFYRGLLEATLKEWGYEVVAVGDGTAAYEALRAEGAPRLAILDWAMPGLDGVEVCRRLRAVACPEPAYLIILTAKGGKDNVVAALEAGADDYVPKPFDREELRARLKTGVRIVGLQAALADRVRRLEGALTEAQKLEVIGRLAGGVAHDFNNLLTVILGSGDLLLSALPPDSPSRETARMIKRSGERGAALVRQLLAFGRKQLMSPVPLDLNARVTQTTGMLRRLLGEDVAVTTVLAPGLPPVLADPVQVEQVLMNLLINARDAMPDGGTVTLTTREVNLPDPTEGFPEAPPGRYVRLSVRDTGCGMDDEVKTRLFEPFFTTKGERGTGLGLATVYGIVRQSGGFIAVESAVGEGTTFRVCLPVAAAPVAAAAGAGKEAPPPGRREVVLLVEDDEGVRVLVRRMLTNHNYEVLEAGDAPEALAAAANAPRPIDLLLTDVVMPGLSGCQLADRLAELRPGVKILFMSGHCDDVVIRTRLFEAGRPFLYKPFAEAELLRKVRQALAGDVRGAAPGRAPAGEQYSRPASRVDL